MAILGTTNPAVSNKPVVTNLRPAGILDEMLSGRRGRVDGGERLFTV